MSFTEMPVARLAELGDLFPGRHLRMVLDSILAGHTGGRLWSLDPEVPGRLSLLWDQGNNVYTLAGDEATEGARLALVKWVASQVRPAALAQGAVYFSARAVTGTLAPLVEDAFAAFVGGRRQKLFHTLGEPAVSREPGPAVDGVGFRPIDADLLSGLLQNAGAVEEEIRWMWPSLERFLSHGWGSAAVTDAAIVCWCTAEYVGPRSCGIGIETVPEWQGRGIATATGARFLAECLARGKEACWECDAQNVPSVRVAAKLGFTCVERHEFLVGRFA